MMEPKSPHSGGAGASNVLGRNSQPSSTIPTIGAIANGPPPAAILRVLRQHSREELSGFVAVALDLLDFADGDPDLEENGDDEPLRANGDCADAAWIEWDRMPGSRKRGPNILPTDNEDDEDSDPAGQYDEDAYTGPRLPEIGAGCPIADPDLEHDGQEEECGI